jgi:hypothetical protein
VSGFKSACGEPDETPEQDAARQAATERMYFGKLVEKLMQTTAMASPAEGEFLRRMDLSLNVLGRQPDRGEIDRLKEIAWKYRRDMRGSALAPKLNPADPIVRESGGG